MQYQEMKVSAGDSYGIHPWKLNVVVSRARCNTIFDEAAGSHIRLTRAGHGVALAEKGR